MSDPNLCQWLICYILFYKIYSIHMETSQYKWKAAIFSYLISALMSLGHGGTFIVLYPLWYIASLFVVSFKGQALQDVLMKYSNPDTHGMVCQKSISMILKPSKTMYNVLHVLCFLNPRWLSLWTRSKDYN